MPVISGESRYEALFTKNPLPARDARQAFWAHLLNSGVAGHTYGANGVWQANLKGNPFGKSPGGNNWGEIPWDEAMRLPGSTQLGTAKRFLETLPWHKMGVVTNLASLKGQAPGTLSTSATADGRSALVYALTQAPVTIDLARFPGPVVARWFDPTGGQIKAAFGSPQPNRGRQDFVPPGMNADGDSDWVLHLESSTTR